MNKKILLGNIIAVVILVLVSFTGVVGYQTTKSSTIAKASPLFKIRTSRAIDDECEDLRCDYVGKDEEINILLPKRNETRELILKTFERISKMNNEELNELKYFLNDKKFAEFEQLVYQIKNNPEVSKEIMENFPPTQSPDGFCTIDGWTPFCYLIFFLIGIPLIIVTTSIIILLLLPILILYGIVIYLNSLETYWCPPTSATCRFES